MTDLDKIMPMDKIIAFCQQWEIRELALFGSALREDFGPESDFDFLVTFNPEANWGLFEHVQMQQELQEMLQRPVDLISRRALERSHNWLRRQEILSTAQPLFREEMSHVAG